MSKLWQNIEHKINNLPSEEAKSVADQVRQELELELLASEFEEDELRHE